VGEAFSPEAMLVIDGPLHHKIRAVWAKPTSLSAADALSDSIRSIADAILAPAAKLLETGETIDLVGLFEEFTSEIIILLMDIPRDHRGDFQRWNRVISDSALLTLGKSDPREEAKEAKDEVYALLRAEIQKRHALFACGQQPEDLISLMVAAEGRDGITASTVLGNLLNLFLGALDTTVRWLGNIVVTLHRHPDVLARIRADPSLLPQAIEEVLRLETIIQMTARIVRKEVVIHGQALQPGDFVYLLPGAANRDPSVFPDPDSFDIDRKPKLHMGFGFGIHQCLGMNIARKEANIFIGRMLDMLPDLTIAQCTYEPAWSLRGPQELLVRSASPH
jgi:cytochrome P450